MRIFLSLLLCLLFAPAGFAASPPPHAEPKANITVLVDANLMIPAASLARAFAKVSNIPLTIVIKNANEAESEIEQGLEAHVLLSANSDLVTKLAEQGLTDVSSTRAVASAQLALVASPGLSGQELVAKHVSFAAMLYATPKIPVYIEMPGSVAGNRANQLMRGYEFSEQLASRAQMEPSPEELLAALEQTPALALMPLPEALTQSQLQLLSVLPKTLSAPITYQAVVLASESMNDARLFTEFLRSPAAQDIFARAGFQPAE